MALFLANTTIYHPGRTAGHWVRKSLALRNLIVGTTQALHDSPPRIQHLPEVKAREHSVSFVRHPADWIRSLWIHESQYGWTMDELKPSHGLASFEEYLEEIIARYPVGAAQHYFSPFLDAVSVNLRTETLAETLIPTLAQFDEPLLAEVAVAPALNRSPNDFVARSAVARKSTWEEYLRTEKDFCERFGYTELRERYVTAAHNVRKPWFPQFHIQGSNALGNERQWPTVQRTELEPDLGPTCLPDQLFHFVGRPVRIWPGDPKCWRSQVAFIDALKQRLTSRASDTDPGSFVELGCGDGFFVYLAEQLGCQAPVGIDYTNRAARDVATGWLRSEARFRTGSPLNAPPEERFDTVLVRNLVNQYPCPHLVLDRVGQWLAPGGMLILSALTASIELGEVLRLGLDPATLGLPPTCRSVPTEACLLAEIEQSGFTVVERYGEFDQFFYNDHPLSRINPAFSPLTPWSLQTLVLGLQRCVPQDEDAARRWFRDIPLFHADLSAADIGDAATRSIWQLIKENAELRLQARDLTGALSDREHDLAQERAEFELQIQELGYRTTRLENAHASLCRLEAAIEDWRAVEPRPVADPVGLPDL